MADSPTNSSLLASGKIRSFVRKNKTLSAVIGLGAAYFGYRQLKKGNSVEVSEEESPSFVGEGEGPLMPSEISNEATDAEIARTEEERENEREHRQEEKELEEENAGKAQERSEKEVEEAEERGEKNGESNSPGEENNTQGAPEASTPESPIETPPPNPAPAPGINIHGRFFPNATKSSIVGSGSTEGGKKYIEYAIYFPGKVEHWQYFTAAGNWREVKNSTTNPGSSGGNGGGGHQHGPAPNPPNHHSGEKKAPAPRHGIGNNHPVGHGGGGGGGGGGAPVCPAGTVQNIQQNRNEVNRLTGEIQQRRQWIGEHPRANARGQWEAEIRDKEGKRSSAQGAVDRGHQVPGCGNV